MHPTPRQLARPPGRITNPVRHRRWSRAGASATIIRSRTSARSRPSLGRPDLIADDPLPEVVTRAASGSTTSSDELTVGAFLDGWLTDVVRLSVRPRTYSSYRYIVALHLAPVLGDIALVSLSPADVQAFLNAKSASGLSPRTVAYLRGVLRGALGHAERLDLVTRNVARLARPPRIPRRRVSPLTVEQAHAFLGAIAGDRLEALYLVALGVGLRQGEILGLRWPDVDLDGRLTASRR